MADRDSEDSEKTERQEEDAEIAPEKQRPEQKPYKTPEQITDEDYKVAPTSADEDKTKE